MRSVYEAVIAKSGADRSVRVATERGQPIAAMVRSAHKKADDLSGWGRITTDDSPRVLYFDTGRRNFNASFGMAAHLWTELGDGIAESVGLLGHETPGQEISHNEKDVSAT